MPLAVAYWIVMLLWLIFGLWQAWPNHYAVGVNIMLFILFIIIGLKVFGSPLHG